MPYKGKPLLKGNPLYKELHYNGKSFIQGEPLINIRGNHSQREINYTRKALIKRNPLYKETPYMWKLL